MASFDYAELHCKSNFSFLKAASHPQELVQQAAELGYSAIAITDECSLAGIVKAHMAAKACSIQLIVGSEFTLSNQQRIVVIAPSRSAYAELSGFITLARRRSSKGHYQAHFEDLQFRLKNCLIIWLAQQDAPPSLTLARQFHHAFKNRLWLGFHFSRNGREQHLFQLWQPYIASFNIPLIALGGVLMHQPKRKRLLDVLYAIKDNKAVHNLGTALDQNEDAYLHSLEDIQQRYAPELIEQTQKIAQRCQFSLNELRYQYPQEVVPEGQTPSQYLRHLTQQGMAIRWPQGAPAHIAETIDKELTLIEEMRYEYFFLTVYDIVQFAKSQNILYQGRGSAANSVVCYCLFITEISPENINVLFERFISKERNEPPDIDVDFENARREEVIQYIYQKYGRERAALAATVITYRRKSAVRDVGKALGFEPLFIEQIAKTIAWWDSSKDLLQRIEESGILCDQRSMLIFFNLVQQILGFPRHLSQHVGGFIIAQDRVSDLVPLENAAMPERTIIQWDKEDLESLGLLKVDVLALGMLTALHKMIDLVGRYQDNICSLADIPREDPATYDMICQADIVGVFQIESRAQMSMLPRLKPRCFYDLVIQIAIVRPGPIQGDMVHPYLRRRQGLEAVHYESAELEQALKPTLGVPLFQEQVIRIAMLAAGFSGGEADELRRAISNWGKNSRLLDFKERFSQGMLKKGYAKEYIERLFEQIKGFGGYGFPESHSASFAILCYVSSWFKCHHPEAFYCALLNSLPMGFYSASQLIQDARRHRVLILPVSVNHSFFDNMLVKVDNENKQPRKAIRLGLSQIKGFQENTAQKIVDARKQHVFVSIADLAQRTQITHSEIERLSSADALRQIAGHRYNAHWYASAVKANTPLLDQHAFKERQAFNLNGPSLEQDVMLDYSALSLTLKAHPLSILRTEEPFKRCTPCAQLPTIGNQRFVQVAGLVTCRQRPGTAKGTLFLTVEDETGNINVVVWKSLQERCRTVLLSGQLILVKGHVEINETVVHVIAGDIVDYSARLADFAGKIRSFH